MEKFYTKDKSKRRSVKAKPETIQFLLSYSKSLEIIEAKGIQFESHLN